MNNSVLTLRYLYIYTYVYVRLPFVRTNRQQNRTHSRALCAAGAHNVNEYSAECVLKQENKILFEAWEIISHMLSLNECCVSVYGIQCIEIKCVESARTHKMFYIENIKIITHIIPIIMYSIYTFAVLINFLYDLLVKPTKDHNKRFYWEDILKLRQTLHPSFM